MLPLIRGCDLSAEIISLRDRRAAAQADPEIDLRTAVDVASVICRKSILIGVAR
jgi:hypothetical protein